MARYFLFIYPHFFSMRQIINLTTHEQLRRPRRAHDTWPSIDSLIIIATLPCSVRPSVVSSLAANWWRFFCSSSVALCHTPLLKPWFPFFLHPTKTAILVFARLHAIVVVAVVVFVVWLRVRFPHQNRPQREWFPPSIQFTTIRHLLHPLRQPYTHIINEVEIINL